MQKALLIAVFSLTSAAATANYGLANSGKAVNCTVSDDQAWVLDAGRTTIQYTVMGSSWGPQAITGTNTDGKTFVSYMTEDGTLTLSDAGDTFQFVDDDAYGITCL